MSTTWYASFSEKTNKTNVTILLWDYFNIVPYNVLNIVIVLAPCYNEAEMLSFTNFNSPLI